MTKRVATMRQLPECACPTVRPGGLTATPTDAGMLAAGLVGGVRYGSRGVLVTQDQLRALAQWVGVKLDCNNQLLEAAAERDVFRAASAQGLRLLAFLARHRLLLRGEDPVRWLAEVLADSGYDVETWDGSEAEAEQSH